jgi:hypothetical protein
MASSSAAVPPIPKLWPRSIQAAILHVMALAHYVLVATRGWGANSCIERVRPAAKADKCDEEILHLREELWLKDARMARIPAHQRPHFQRDERLVILELRAVRGWSLAQTADTFHLSKETIRTWTTRLDEEGSDFLTRTVGADPGTRVRRGCDPGTRVRRRGHLSDWSLPKALREPGAMGRLP